MANTALNLAISYFIKLIIIEMLWTESQKKQFSKLMSSNKCITLEDFLSSLAVSRKNNVNGTRTVLEKQT